MAEQKELFGGSLVPRLRLVYSSPVVMFREFLLRFAVLWGAT